MQLIGYYGTLNFLFLSVCKVNMDAYLEIYPLLVPYKSYHRIVAADFGRVRYLPYLFSFYFFGR